jgi:multiple sugar transport system permease protein
MTRKARLRTKTAGSLKDRLFVFFMLLPIFTCFFFIRFVPIGSTLLYSFFKRSLLEGSQGFVGLSNYTDILTEPGFWKAIWNTLYFTVIATSLSLIAGLAIAQLTNSRHIRGGKVYQSLYYIPVVISLVPATLIWKILFDYNYGFINYLLSFVMETRIEWLMNPKICIYPVVVVSVWKDIGYNMIIFIVGLKAIPDTYYESAEIDGASKWRTFRSITLPLLKPITLFVLVMSIIRNVKVFTQAYVMSTGSQGSGEILKTIVYYIYQTGFQFFNMGSASAISILLLVMVFFFTWLQFRISKE